MTRWFLVVFAGIVASCSAPSSPTNSEPVAKQTQPNLQLQEAQKLNNLPPVNPSLGRKSQIDHSGRTQTGKASYYAKSFDGKKMADGNRLDPSDNVAASKTLPIGTTAKVTNLDTGKSAIVTVEDRGPHVRGRVIDVTRSVATKLDLHEKGVAPVQVKPIAVPQPDGGVKLGSGAAVTPPAQVQAAVKTTQQVAQ